jgi:hypothetical protein
MDFVQDRIRCHSQGLPGTELECRAKSVAVADLPIDDRAAEVRLRSRYGDNFVSTSSPIQVRTRTDCPTGAGAKLCKSGEYGFVGSVVFIVCDRLSMRSTSDDAGVQRAGARDSRFENRLIRPLRFNPWFVAFWILKGTSIQLQFTPPVASCHACSEFASASQSQ